MRRLNRIITAAAAVLTICLSASCRREPLHELRSSYYLDLDISLESLYKQPQMPSTVTAVFYDHETGEMAFQEFVSGKGGYLYGVTPGTYDILLYSLGTTFTHVEDISRMDEAYAHTNRISPEYNLKYEPDHLLVGTLYNQVIPALVEFDDTFVIHAHMETIVDTWKLIVRKIKGLRNATSIGIMIDGLVDSKKLASRIYSDTEMNMYFAGVIDNEYRLIETPFCIFGKLPGEVSELNLQISVIGDDGASYKLKTDVTDQFNDPDNTQHLIIVDFDIEIKAKEGGGFQPVVDKWEDVVINFEL